MENTDFVIEHIDEEVQVIADQPSVVTNYPANTDFFIENIDSNVISIAHSLNIEASEVDFRPANTDFFVENIDKNLIEIAESLSLTPYEVTIRPANTDMFIENIDKNVTLIKASTNVVTVSGEYININLPDGGKVQSAQIDGNATQTTYSGKNLANYLDAVKATAETMLTFVDDGFRQVTTATGFGTKLQLTGLESSTTYTLSFNLAVTSGTANKVIRVFEGTAQSVTYAVLNPATAGANSLSFTTGESATSVNIWFYNGIPGAGDTTWTKIMVEKGSSASSYEPYVGGTPAPNPEFPMPISTVTGENVVKVVGKNLFHFTESRTVTAGGVTFETTEGTSVLKINGTSASSSNFSTNLIRDTSPLTLEAGTYTIKIDGLNRITNTTDYAYLGKVGIGAFAYMNPNNNWQTTFTLTKKTSLYMQGVFAPSAAYDNKDVTIQLELGNQATEYQAYTEQDYEINLGKNLFNCDIESGGLLSSTGQPASADNRARTDDYITVEPNTPYTINASMTGTTTKISVFMYKGDGTFISPSLYLANAPRTFTTTADTAKVKFAFANSDDSVFDYTDVKNAQLEKGTATPYAPYFTPLELAKIGTYQDRIYKDGEKWYVGKQLGKLTWNGSENWLIANSGTESFYYVLRQLNLGLTSNVTTLMSNYGSYGSIGNTGTNQGMMVFTANNNEIRIRYGTEIALADWKAKLTSLNMDFYYPLPTPTITEITDQTLIDQLEALASATLNQGVNNIWIEIATGNAMPTLKLVIEKY